MCAAPRRTAPRSSPASVLPSSRKRRRLASVSRGRRQVADRSHGLLVQLLQVFSQARISLLLFGFLILKVLLVAKGDLVTALGVINVSGVVTVVVGAALSALPIVAAILLGFGTYVVASGTTRPAGWTTARTSGSFAVVAIAAMILSPWHLAAAVIGVSLVGGLIDRFRRNRKRRAVTRWHGQDQGERSRLLHRGFVLATVTVFFLSLNSLFYAMWLPHEVLHLQSGSPQVGYVLSDSNGWVTVLTSHDRKVKEYRAIDVEVELVEHPSQAHSSSRRHAVAGEPPTAGLGRSAC